MARTSFYNDNENRDYPFLRDTSFIPVSAIVDCAFLVGDGSGHRVDEHNVRLLSVRREGDWLYFSFESDADLLAGSPLVFSRSVSADPYETEHLPELSGSVSEPECDAAPAFSGYLVTGDLADLLELLPTDGELTGEAIVEPANCRELESLTVRSLNLANMDRTRYETPDGCPAQTWPDEIQPVHVVATCLTGPMRLVEGFNLRVSQDRTDGLRLHAAVGAGAGEACGQVAVYSGETTPDDSVFLEGGPACDEVVRRINGLGGPVVPLLAGLGVSIVFDPDNHLIILTIDGRNTPTAFPDDGLDGLSCSETYSVG